MPKGECQDQVCLHVVFDDSRTDQTQGDLTADHHLSMKMDTLHRHHPCSVAAHHFSALSLKVLRDSLCRRTWLSSR